MLLFLSFEIANSLIDITVSGVFFGRPCITNYFIEFIEMPKLRF